MSVQTAARPLRQPPQPVSMADVEPTGEPVQDGFADTGLNFQEFEEWDPLRAELTTLLHGHGDMLSGMGHSIGHIRAEIAAFNQAVGLTRELIQTQNLVIQQLLGKNEAPTATQEAMGNTNPLPAKTLKSSISSFGTTYLLRCIICCLISIYLLSGQSELMGELFSPLRNYANF